VSEYGLTEEGFRRKRLPDIKASLEQAFRDEFGSDLDLRPESVFGQLIGVLAAPMAEEWEELENVYHSQYPDSAEGFSLDGAASLTGITRQDALATTVQAVVYGEHNTTLGSGSEVSQAETGDVYRLANTTTITRNAVVDALIEVDPVEEGDYTLTVGGIDHTYTAGAGDDEADILAGLAALEIDDVTLEVVDGQLRFTVDNLAEPVELAVSANLELVELGSRANFEAVDLGAQVVPVGTLTEIETPVGGWDRVDNLVEGVTGRDRETDAELRARREQSIRVAGAATVEAIRANIRELVAGVTGATVIENTSLTEDAGGRPGKSFELVVSGGDDQEIAQQLWELKPAGIETFGQTEVVITDSQGFEQLMKFSRPTERFIHVEVELTLTPEETFPSDGAMRVAENILAFGENLDVGEDVFRQRLFRPIYEVPGIAEATLRIAATADPEDTPSFAEDNIAIDNTEIAIFDLDRIEVTVT